MMLVSQLRSFYDDLQDVRYTSRMAMVHSRFSTNTFPSWSKAHPQRMLLHNGEINTIRGNHDRMKAREETMRSPVMGEEMRRVLPVVTEGGSDSHAGNGSGEGDFLGSILFHLIDSLMGLKFFFMP
jgi:glutamate synthase (ferredoxin)